MYSVLSAVCSLYNDVHTCSTHLFISAFPHVFHILFDIFFLKAEIICAGDVDNKRYGLSVVVDQFPILCS